jgi:hypothetical protein
MPLHAQDAPQNGRHHCPDPIRYRATVFSTIFPSFTITTKFFPGSSSNLMYNNDPQFLRL